MRTFRCSSPEGVSAQGGVYPVVCLGMSDQGDVCPGFICPGVVYPSMHWGRPLPCGQNSWHTLVKILPCCNFVTDGNNLWYYFSLFLIFWNIFAFSGESKIFEYNTTAISFLSFSWNNLKLVNKTTETNNNWESWVINLLQVVFPFVRSSSFSFWVLWAQRLHVKYQTITKNWNTISIILYYTR